MACSISNEYFQCTAKMMKEDAGTVNSRDGVSCSDESGITDKENGDIFVDDRVDGMLNPMTSTSDHVNDFIQEARGYPIPCACNHNIEDLKSFKTTLFGEPEMYSENVGTHDLWKAHDPDMVMGHDEFAIIPRKAEKSTIPCKRKYEAIENHTIVKDYHEVKKKMKASFLKKECSVAVLMDMNRWDQRKRIDHEVIEQEVYGIDSKTYKRLLNTMRELFYLSEEEQYSIIEKGILPTLNKACRHYTMRESPPKQYDLSKVVSQMAEAYEETGNMRLHRLCKELFFSLQQHPQKICAYRKGLGLVCNKKEGFQKDEFIVEFLGEVYPLWRWYERTDGIKYYQKKHKHRSKEIGSEFYNFSLTRFLEDDSGYDAVMIDGTHKSNFLRSISHSCQPNCEATIKIVSGMYEVCVSTIQPISFGEELTYNYNAVTECKEDVENSVCLCGSHLCKGSYFSYSQESSLNKVLKKEHNILDRVGMLLRCCVRNYVTDEDYALLSELSVRTSMLSGLPEWAVAYAADVVRFVKQETMMFNNYANAFNHKLICNGSNPEHDETDPKALAERIFCQRLADLATTLDKVKYILKRCFKNPKEAPPPLRLIEPTELIPLLWTGDNSMVSELIRSMKPYVNDDHFHHLLKGVSKHTPVDESNLRSLRSSLLWLRNELLSLPSSCKSKNYALADLLHLYASTRAFFTMNEEYLPVTSDPIRLTPLDLGFKPDSEKEFAHLKWKKTYSRNYVAGQLIYWFKQTYEEPDKKLRKKSAGCIVLPEISSSYGSERVYSNKETKEIVKKLEKESHKSWKNGFWKFGKGLKVLGSPIFDRTFFKISFADPSYDHCIGWLKKQSQHR